MTSLPSDSIDSHDLMVVLRQFSNDLISKTSLNEVLWTITGNAISNLGFEDCVVYLVSENGQFLEQKAAYGPKNPEQREIASAIRIPMGMGIVGSVAETGIAEIVEDCSADARYIPDDAFRMSELAVPIIKDNKVIGVIDSEHSEVGFFTQGHLDILETIGSITSIRLNQIQSRDAVIHDRDSLKDTVVSQGSELQDAMRELQAINEQLTESLEEKHRSLASLNHQINNQMQMVHSLMNIQAESSGSADVRDNILLAQCRVRCIGLVYQIAAGKEVDPVKYLHDLHDELVGTYKITQRVNLEVEVNGVWMPTAKAVQLGFILVDFFSGSVSMLENTESPSSSIKLTLGQDCQVHLESNWWDFDYLKEITKIFISQMGAEKIDSQTGLTLVCK